MRCQIRLVYLFLYNLLQFCGHTWVFSNMTARFLTFGGDAVADTFYAVGVVMSLCQLLSVLELFHIADGIEKGMLLARFIEVTERNFLLFVVIVCQEEVQSKPIVSAQFYLWNSLALLRYPHRLLSLASTPSFNMLWAYHTLWILVYPLSVLAEGVTIFQALPYFESPKTHVFQLVLPANVHFPHVLLCYLPLLVIGSSVTVWQLLQERRQQLENWTKKLKRQ